MRAAGVELQRALLGRAGDGAAILWAHDVPWMSATFAGARHELAVAMPDAAVAGFCDGIADIEFPLRGHLLADIAIVGHAPDHVLVEALTIQREEAVPRRNEAARTHVSPAMIGTRP